MKKVLSLFILALCAVVVHSQTFFTPQAPSGGYYELRNLAVRSVSLRDSTDTLVYTVKSPMYPIWGSTSNSIVGMHTTNSALTYVVKYRVTDPQGQYTGSTGNYTSAIAATTDKAKLYTYVTTPSTIWVEWQVTVYAIGATSTTTGTTTFYTVDFKQK